MKDCATSCQGLKCDTFVGVIRYHTRRSLYCLFFVRGHEKKAACYAASSSALEF